MSRSQGSTALLGEEQQRRDAVFTEAIRRSPVNLHPFVLEAFELYDNDVLQKKRTYRQVSFVEMLNIATNLQKRGRRVAPPTQPLRAPMQYNSSNYSSPSSSSPMSPSYAPNGGNSRKRQRDHAATAKDEAFFCRIASVTANTTTTTSTTFTALSNALERKYSRYEPTSEDIRPLSVLTRAFHHIKEKARQMEANEGRSASLRYLSDQLKGMRQDIRVQNIKNDFAVDVYQTHARIALERADVGEFNQCQAALKTFYLADGINKESCSISEFFLYRIVYLALSQQNDSLSTELIHFTNAKLRKKSPWIAFVAKKDVQLALKLCAACEEGDCSIIGAMLQRLPKHMVFLLRMYLRRLRIYWLQDLLCASRGNIAVSYLQRRLGYLSLVPSLKEALWLDGSQEAAEQEFRELFTLIKLPFPTSRPSAAAGDENDLGSLDSATLLHSVQKYIQYLTTRKDASI